METKKYTLKLNNEDKIEQLLQEIYNQSCQQYNKIQDEISKIANSTTIKDLDIDGKEKYGKIINNYIVSQQKALAQKQDVAKLMAEVLKYNGNVDDALKGMKTTNTTLDLNKLRQLAKDASTSGDDNVTQYTLKN